MNIKRGLKRIWLVVSILFSVFVFLYIGGEHSQDIYKERSRYNEAKTEREAITNFWSIWDNMEYDVRLEIIQHFESKKENHEKNI